METHGGPWGFLMGKAETLTRMGKTSNTEGLGEEPGDYSPRAGLLLLCLGDPT